MYIVGYEFVAGINSGNEEFSGSARLKAKPEIQVVMITAFGDVELPWRHWKWASDLYLNLGYARLLETIKAAVRIKKSQDKVNRIRKKMDNSKWLR